MIKRELGSVCSRLSSGKSIRAENINPIGAYPVIGGNGLRGYTDSYNFDGECAVIGRQGAACGNVRYHSGKAYMTEHAVVVCANDENDTRYLSYLLSIQNLGRLSAQSAQPGISVKTLSKQEVCLPPLDEQKRVSQLLGTIDSKINANTKLNDYLEQLLLARFDRLFQSADSFNGTISDIGEVVGGATPSKKRPEYYCHRGIGWITPRDLSNTSDKFIAHGADDITQAGFDSCSAKKLPAGSVLFSSRAPIGYIAIASDEVTTNQGFKSIVPRAEVGTAFVYCFLVRNKYRIADAGSGTTFPEVSGKTMASIGLVLPDVGRCAEFEEWAKPILKEQFRLEEESHGLGRLRDALLPKLMSGEIDVSKVDLTQPNNHLCAD